MTQRWQEDSSFRSMRDMLHLTAVIEGGHSFNSSPSIPQIGWNYRLYPAPLLVQETKRSTSLQWINQCYKLIVFVQVLRVIDLSCKIKPVCILCSKCSLTEVQMKGWRKTSSWSFPLELIDHYPKQISQFQCMMHRQFSKNHIQCGCVTFINLIICSHCVCNTSVLLLPCWRIVSGIRHQQAE